MKVSWTDKKIRMTLQLCNADFSRCRIHDSDDSRIIHIFEVKPNNGSLSDVFINSDVGNVHVFDINHLLYRNKQLNSDLLAKWRKMQTLYAAK